MSEGALQFLLAPVLLQSFGGYLWLASWVKRQGGRLAPGAFGLPDLMVCTVLAVAFIQIAVLSFSSPSPPNAMKSLRPMEILAGPLFLLIISFGVAGFLVFRRVSMTEFFGWKRMPLWKAAVWALALLFLAWPALAALSHLVSQFLPKDMSQEQMVVALFRHEVRQGHYPGIASIFLAAVLLAPLAEEFLFRGYFYPVGKRYFGALPSGVLTAVVFALLHANAVSFAGLFLLALCLTLAYEFTGSLLVPMVMHATFNAISLTVLFFQALGTAA